MEVSTARYLSHSRGHYWRELLESGHYASIDALAARMRANASYAGRHLSLGLLAPDTVEALITGREPDGLSLEKRYRASTAWEEQRRVVRMG